MRIFARNDFYESKILKILTLPRSGCQPITRYTRSWDNCAYFVPNVCQFIIFKFYIVTSQLELKISFVSSFLRNLVPFAYFARNDFYESKILKILILPRSGCQPITHFIRSWDNCAYFVPNVLCNSKNC